MTLIQRIRSVFSALMMIFCAVILLLMKENGYRFVTLLLSLSLIVYGARTLIYYFTMARHMVDGRSIFYKGILVLDFGLFTLSISQNFNIVIVIYLLFVHAFSGVIGILHALEEKRFQAGSWRLSMIQGLINIAFAAAAVIFGFFLGDMNDLTLTYAAGLVWSAISQLIMAFRKTAIVYIQ